MAKTPPFLISSINSIIKSDLINWKKGSISGKKMAWVGDSTTYLISITPQNLAYLVNNYQSPGGPLAGVVMQWHGSNGNTLANFVNSYPLVDGLSSVIAGAPDLIVLSYGINDVRLGNTSQAQLTALLKQAVNALRASLPSCDIILRMPNSLLTTDVGGFGYVVPNASAQAYTDILRNAYQSLKNYWPNVVVYDSQESRFSATCQTLSVRMADQLHPSTASGTPGSSNGGFAGIIDDIVSLSGYPVEYNKSLAASAVLASYADAHLTYPRVVENGDYILITEGAFSTQGSGFIRFGGDVSKLTNIMGGDILVQDGQAAITLNSGNSFGLNGTNIQIANLGAGIPTYAQTAGKVQIWRHKYLGNISCKPYLNNAAYPFKRNCVINSGGTNYLRVSAFPNEADISLANLSTSDYLLHPDLGAVSLATAYFSYQSAGVVQINITGNFAIFSGHTQCAIVSTGSMRNTKANILPIRYSKSPVTTISGDGTYVVSRGGYYSSAYGKLSEPLTPGITTVVVKRNGSAVATLSFAAGNMSATVSWTSGAGFTVYAGDFITFDVTAGTGISDISIALDA